VSAEKPTVSPGILQVGGISLRDLFAVAAIASGSSSRDAYLAADQAMALREATAPADSSRGETCNDVFAGLVCEEPRGHVGQHREGLNVWSEERKAAFAAKFGAEFIVPADDAPGALIAAPVDPEPVRGAVEVATGFLGEFGDGEGETDEPERMVPGAWSETVFAQGASLGVGRPGAVQVGTDALGPILVAACGEPVGPDEWCGKVMTHSGEHGRVKRMVGADRAALNDGD
jgi:hypothetical protein